MHIFAWSPSPYTQKNRRRPIITPLHRFQRIESMLIDPRARFDGSPGRCGRGRRWSHRPRIPRPFDEIESMRPRTERCDPIVGGSPSRGGTDAESNSSSEVTNTTNGPILPDNFNRFRMGNINWGLWGCLVVVTTLLVPAHIYLKQYAFRGELMGVVFVITVLFLVCFSFSMFHTKTRAILLHRLHLEEEEERAQCPTDGSNSPVESERDLSSFPTILRQNEMDRRPVRASISTPELQLNGQTRILGDYRGYPQNLLRSMSRVSRSPSSRGDHSGEPPPYEVAINLPSPEILSRSCETPPPAYDIIQS